MSKFIVTYTPYFKKSVIREIQRIDKAAALKFDYTDGISLVESELSKDEFVNIMLNSDIIFIKHIMPVMLSGDITCLTDSDKQSLLNETKKIADISAGDKFAVQCRIVKGGLEGLEYSSKDIEVYVGEFYTDLGAVPSFSDSQIINDNIKIISIFIYKECYYIGFSQSTENLNFHCDEYRICSRTGREISRAENKLKEALIKFQIMLDGVGNALDIGAAPGGWTKVLCDYGYDVVAVDPGDLKENLRGNRKIKHYKCRIEELDFQNYFDIITNDMNVDPQVSSQIMVSLADSLKDGGLAVLTLKLPGKVEESIKESVNILDKRYDVLTIKNLFHNRQEVTALLRKK